MPIRKDLTDDQLITIYKAYVIVGEGVRKQDLLKGISENCQCTLPIAYRILYDHQHLFNYDQRKKLYHLYEQYYFDPQEYQTVPQSLENLNSFLDKVVKFVSTKPNNDDFLILVGVLREQLQDGITENIDRLLILLEQKYGNEAESLIAQGKGVPETKVEGAETAVPETSDEESEEPKTENKETTETEVVEI